MDEDLREIYQDFYKGSPFIRLKDSPPDLRGVVGSNFCDIGFETDRDRGRIVVVSAIDNLTKGASGQAVQNMNLMLGLQENLGLDLVGLYP
jgi:N-acetyl-gamma-glutamyl-phosphate reductase